MKAAHMRHSGKVNQEWYVWLWNMFTLGMILSCPALPRCKINQQHLEILGPEAKGNMLRRVSYIGNNGHSAK